MKTWDIYTSKNPDPIKQILGIVQHKQIPWILATRIIADIIVIGLLIYIALK